MSRKRKRGNMVRNSGYKKGKNYLFLKLIVFLLSIIAILFFARTINNKFFVIKKIYSNYKLSSAIENKVIGKNIFSLDLEKIANQIKSYHIKVKNVSLQKQLPSYLWIVVTERIPVSEIKQNNYYFLLDEEAVPIQVSNQPFANGVVLIETDHLPKLIKQGQPINQEHIKLSCILAKILKEKLIDSQIPVSRIIANSIYSILFEIDGAKIIVGRANFIEKVDHFIKLYNQVYYKDLSNISYIDLRNLDKGENIYIGHRR